MTRICVSVCEKTIDALESAAVRASESADIVELRIDCLTRLEDLTPVLNRISCPVILTFRPDEQGGQDRKSTRLNSSHGYISYAVFCLKRKTHQATSTRTPVRR